VKTLFARNSPRIEQSLRAQPYRDNVATPLPKQTKDGLVTNVGHDTAARREVLTAL